MLPGVRLRVLFPEDTAVFKMLFFRGKDFVDVERLLGIMQGSLDLAYVREALLEVVGEDQFIPPTAVTDERRGPALSAWAENGLEITGWVPGPR